MVLLYHAPGMLPGHDFYYLTAVNLFFSISGFLIAQMLVERFDGASSRRAVELFLINRWMRTFPLYFLTLAVFVLLSAITGAQGPTPVYAVFLQSLTRGNEVFGPSWTLCIEEWFYLLCPLVVFIAGRHRRSVRLWVIIGAALIAFVLIARIDLYLRLDRLTWEDQDAVFNRATLLRLDVFVWGMGAYFVRPHVRRPSFIAIIGAAILLVDYMIYQQSSDGWFVKVILPSLTPAATALLIPWALSLRAPPFMAAITAFLSTRTYAIYLLFYPVMFVWFVRFPETVWGIAGAAAMTVFLANLAYLAIERPIMRLRPMRAPATIPALAE